MLIDGAVRVNRWLERHARLVAFVTAAVFIISCAHYARFITLPEIVAVPVTVTGIASGLRYALWDGWLKKRAQARVAGVRNEIKSEW